MIKPTGNKDGSNSFYIGVLGILKFLASKQFKDKCILSLFKSQRFKLELTVCHSKDIMSAAHPSSIHFHHLKENKRSTEAKETKRLRELSTVRLCRIDDALITTK